MKKILLSLAFIAFSFSMNAQNVIERQTIKDNPNGITPFIDGDISLLSTNFSTVSELQLKQLQRLFYYKYVALSSNIEGEELETYIESVKTGMQEILGVQLYNQITQNQSLFDRLSGQLYLVEEES